MENILEKALRVLQFIWLLPATLLVWLFYILPLWLIFKEIQYIGMTEFLVFEFENPINTRRSWYDQEWEKWAGCSGPCVYILKRHYGPGGHEFDDITRKHEVRHCIQQFWLGVFFYPAYGLAMAWTLISNIWSSTEKHPYHDNPFERDARKAAGQKVNISREDWMDGPDDYCPWL